MGAITDLVDLVTQLSKSVKDEKLAAGLKEIQNMTESILSEHAAIHEKRIELMTENAELKQRNASLQQEITVLRQGILDLKGQNTEAVDNLPKEVEATDQLPKEAEEVLMLFTKYKDVTSEQIARYATLDLSRTEHWLDLLEEKNMVYSSLVMMSETTYYSLAPEGQKYLFAKNLIS